MNILQTKWLEHKIMGLDVILNHDQVQMLDILSVENLQLRHQFHREYRLVNGGKLTLKQVISQHHDMWSNFQINDQLELDHCLIICGEGEMGNEGFIAKTDKNNALEWMLFSTSSNPFVSIYTKNDLVYLKSTYNFYIVFNLLTHEIYIENGR